MEVLNKSRVVFDDITHSYWLGDKELSGITSMLTRQLFYGKYDGVPSYILDKACEKGSAIHKDIEQNNFDSEYEEVQAFYTEVGKQCLDIWENEYLVSDNEHYASCIDIVLRNLDGSFSLADIKTIYQLDKNYVSWQLSVYAYFFELQNPEARIDKLLAVWLRGDKCEISEVYRHPVDEVKALLQSDIEGRVYGKDNLPVPMTKEMLDITAYLHSMRELVNEFNEKEKALKEYLLNQMAEKNIKSLEIGGMKITYKEPYTTSKLDTKKLKEELPNIDDYMVHSAVKGSVTIKFS